MRGDRSDLRARRTATADARPVPPARPAVTDDGDELEVVWYPHRDALELLPQDYPTVRGELSCEVNKRALIRHRSDTRGTKGETN